jgi:hypothetical protein
MSVAVKTADNMEQDPDNPKQADDGDIQMEYYSD